MNEVTAVLRRKVGSHDVMIEVRDLYWTSPLEVRICRPDHVLTQFLIRSSRVRAESRYGNGSMEEMGPFCLVPAEIPCYARTLGTENGRTRTRVVHCHFEPTRFREVTGLGETWREEDLIRCRDIRDPFIFETMTHLVKEAIAPGFASDIFVESLGHSLMVGLARHFRPFEQKPSAGGGKLPAWLQKRIVDYVETYSDRRITTVELGEVCGLSGDHLRRLFRQSTGQTLHRYVEQCRLAKARSMLVETDLSIAEIARKLGFSHPSNFAVSFARLTGQQPTAFRQMLRGWR
ncbi:MAG TPA: AraC family transcriptional regulator [Alphaproteobacteria bacterium]|nr:AraC family transcriptional regulator [Alphaproteobacteria bacterium]